MNASVMIWFEGMDWRYKAPSSRYLCFYFFFFFLSLLFVPSVEGRRYDRAYIILWWGD